MVRMRFSVIERVPAFTFNDKCRRQTNERNLVELFVPPSVPYRQRRHCSNDRFPSTVDVLAHNGGDDSRRRRHPRGHHPIPMLASSCCDKYIVVVCRDEMKTPLTSVRGFFRECSITHGVYLGKKLGRKRYLAPIQFKKYTSGSVIRDACAGEACNGGSSL
jgi:hypothetical protein